MSEDDRTDLILKKEFWLIRIIKKYRIITFTLGFLFFSQFFSLLLTYFFNKDSYLKTYSGLNIWLMIIMIPVVYFLQWLLVVWVASKLPKEKLQQKLLKHPIATIVMFIIFVIDLPNRFASYGGGLVSTFETIIYYAFVSLVWWLLVCWISSKIFKKERLQWRWYQKLIEKIFIILPTVYKIILGIVIAVWLFYVIYLLLTALFKYSGKDLQMLFP